MKEKMLCLLKNSPHPGDFIRTEIIIPAGLTVTVAAKALHVYRPAPSSLLNGKADLSGDMALRVEKAFGVKMDTLMRMNSSCAAFPPKDWLGLGPDGRQPATDHHNWSPLLFPTSRFSGTLPLAENSPRIYRQ